MADPSRDNEPPEVSAAKVETGRSVDVARFSSTTAAGRAAQLKADMEAIVASRPDFDFDAAFDPLVIDWPTMAAFGKRRTGKTFLSRHVLSELVERGTLGQWGVVFTETKTNGFWEQYHPSEFIYEQYDSSVMAGILELQRVRKDIVINYGGVVPDHLADAARYKVGQVVTDESIGMYVIFDDFMGKSLMRMRHDNVLSQVLTLGRHLNMSIIFCAQALTAVPPTFRKNFDYIFLMPQADKGSVEVIHEEWLSMVTPNKNATGYLIDAATPVETDEHRVITGTQALVIDNAHQDVRGIDRLYLFRPEDPGPFRMGSPEFWAQNERVKEAKSQI